MSFQIGLSKKHANKLMKGNGFQLKHHELDGTGIHRYEISLPPSVHKRFVKAFNQGKGFRFPKSLHHKLIEGGSTYAHRLARRTRNTFKPVVDAGKTVVNAVKSSVPTLKNIYNDVKPFLKPILKTAIPLATTAGLAYIGAPPQMGAPVNAGLNKLVDGMGIHRQPRLKSTTSNLRGGIPLPLRLRGGSMVSP